eukprot:TRINITY_DN9025_c0_g1_i5.p1 TRINITY_DN9025_c0_g1~~TRINITY_DN9025_c0_g1_i5.p1  ORF type:complete len:1151 (-),score=139.08 TRINITY_DN9025_c0_g1_i5:222-3674(-)
MNWLLHFIATLPAISAYRLTDSYDARLTVSGTEAPGALDIPDLGRFGDRYQVLEYVTRGGQAMIWKALDRTLGKQVILRFPSSMCRQLVCLVEELHPDTIAESLEGCNLASAALNRFQEFVDIKYPTRLAKIDGHSLVPLPYDPFVKCLQALSTERSDPAFEVWTMAGNSTLAEEFFLGEVHIRDKRRVWEQLKLILASLADSTLPDMPCCCRKSSPTDCTVSPKLSIVSQIMGHKCPSNYKLKPGHCGPIIHHDIKFDNVMLRRGSSSDISPVVIDFGAAALCGDGSAHGYSRDWVPYWIRSPQYQYSISNTECFGYDLYALGVAWLATELLQNLDSATLVCRAADMLGLTSLPRSPRVRTQPTGGVLVSTDDTTDDMVLERSKASGARSRTASCGSDTIFTIDENLKSTALRPVNLFVRKLHAELLNADNLESEDTFKDSLRRFIAKQKNETTEGKDDMHLTFPAVDVVGVIFPLLRECPSALREETLQVLKCRLDAASRRLKEAVKSNHSVIPRRLLQYREACSRMSDQCTDGQAMALMALISNNDSEAIDGYFSSLEEGERTRLANTILADGESLLAMAAQSRLERVVEVLLRNGARTGVSENQVILKHLTALESKAIPSTADMSQTALWAAAKQPGNRKVLRMLLDKATQELGQRLDDRGNDIWDPSSILSTALSLPSMGMNGGGPTLLSITAESGDLEMLQLVLAIIRPSVFFEKALNHWFVGSASHTPLLRAAAAGKAEACRCLLHAGANIQILDSRGWTVLHLAVSSESLPTVQAVGLPSKMAGLHDAMIPATNSTPLHTAAAGSDPEIVQALLSLGENAIVKNWIGDTALHVAIQKESPSVQIVQMLAQSDGAQAATNIMSQTPLVVAASNCQSVDVLIALVQAASPAVLRRQCQKGYSALHWAAYAGQLDCLQALVRHASIDSFGMAPRGITALMTAVQEGQVPAIRVLMKSSAKDYAFTKDARGRPLALFAGWRNKRPRMGPRATLETLVDLAGPQILQEQDPFGMSVLGRWAYDGNVTMVKFLLKAGADCNATFKQTAGVSRDVEESIFGGLGRISGWTALKMVRKRMDWLRKIGTLPKCECHGASVSCADDNSVSYMGAGTGSWVCGFIWASLDIQLHGVQVALERAGCDGQDTERL